MSEQNEQKRKLVAIIENGSVARGYLTIHYVNEEGQETRTPRDIDLTSDQIDQIRSAIETVISA